MAFLWCVVTRLIETSGHKAEETAFRVRTWKDVQARSVGGTWPRIAFLSAGNEGSHMTGVSSRVESVCHLDPPGHWHRLLLPPKCQCYLFCGMYFCEQHYILHEVEGFSNEHRALFLAVKQLGTAASAHFKF